ncbi:hypothetical protein AB0M95_26375 [Sphaerisporangium sp. NPDC051017]|uniref:hypothetical protein n=1 Tax=Sphaerisporangium sp. NPDC051017 TaxID=3154636 RepID=UPI0034226BA4
MRRFMVPRHVEVSTCPLPRTPTEKIAKAGPRRRGPAAETWDAELDDRVGARGPARR